MEQRAQEQQLELLMLAADEATPRLFDVDPHGDREPAQGPPERSPQPGRDAGGDGR